MELITSLRVLWICLLLVGSGEGFPATKGGSESPSSTKAPNEDPQSYKPDKFIMPSDSNQGSVSLTAPPTEAGDQPPSREDTDLGVSSSSLVHSVSPAWHNPPMLDFGDGPVPYIGGLEAYHFGPGSFPFGAIESVQKGIAESTAATGGRVDGPVPYDGDTQYSNVGYPVTNEGQTGLDDGPFPYDGAKPVSKDFSPRGLVDGPVPYDDDTQYANAAPINAGQTGSNPAAPGGLYDRPDPYGGAKPVSINMAPSGLVDGPVPFGSDTQYPNVGYPVTKEGQTGRSTADGPVPYERASHYTNTDPTKDSQSGNPGSIPSGAVPEVISYGYGGYPLGNMDVAESNTTASGRVDGPVPYGGATRHTNANPVKKDSQSGNLGSIPSGVAPEVLSYGYGFYPFGNMDVADRNTAASGRVDGPVPFGGDTRYASAAPINAGQTGSNPAATGGLYDRPDPHSGATRYPNAKPLSINVAPSGLDDGPVPFGDDTQYPNAGYDVTKEGQTGLYDGPVPYDGATRYANAKPVSKDSQSGNPGFVSTGVVPEVISYGYGGYPFANMDFAPRGRVDGPFPFGGDTRYANAAPINGGQTGSNPGGLDDGTVPFGGATHYSNVGYPVTNKGQTIINTADGPVPYEPTDPVVFPWAKTSFMKPNNWRPPFWGFAQWEPITETPVSDKSPPLSSSYLVQSRNGYQREKEVLSHSSFSPESDGPPDSEFFEAPRRRKTPGSLSIAGTKVF